MTVGPVPDLPAWAALAVALLVFVGAAFTFVGSVGLIRLRSFYDRAHAPTIGSSGGVFCIVTASVLCFSLLQSRLVIHEVLIFIFVTLTMPITLMLLARAALFRDRAEGDPNVPPLMPDKLFSTDDEPPAAEPNGGQG